MISALRTASTGVATASAQFDRAAEAVASAAAPSGPSDTVDLSSAAISLIGAEIALQVDVAILKAASESDSRVLDILA